MVAAIGGDGTVGNVAQALVGTNVPIGVVPTGTANNVALALGLKSLDGQAVISSWETAIRQPFDIGVARGPWGVRRFLESVGAGLLSETMLAIDEGHARYVNDIGQSEPRIAAALEVFRRMLLEVEARDVALRLDGADLSGRFVLIEALNFGAAGPNLQFAPQCDPRDGLLDLVLAEDVDRHMLRDRLDQFRSDPTGAPALRTHRGRRLELTCVDCVLHLDDELWRSRADANLSVAVSVEPGALTFLVPATSTPRSDNR